MNTGPRVSEHDSFTAGSCATCGALLDRVHLEESLDGWHCVFCGARQATPIAEHSGRSDPMGVGTTFSQAREARRESLEHAARETHINERFLQALEDDAPPDAFPGEIYGRFFLREYAEYLGLEPGPLLRRYDRATSEPTLEPLGDPALPKDPARHARLVTIVAALVLATVAAFSWWSAGRPDAATPVRAASFSPSPPAVTHEGTKEASGGSAHRTPPGLRATVILSAPCWVQVTLDGRATPGRTRQAGSRLMFRADRTMYLTLGNAGGAKVLVDGRPVPTGASGEVVHLSFVWRDGHVVDRSA
jgi:cytoskeletal protein RodZ